MAVIILKSRFVAFAENPRFSQACNREQITVPPDYLLRLDRHLSMAGYSVQSSEVLDIPVDSELEAARVDENTRDASRSLIEELKEHPDVHDVRISPEL